MPSESPNDERSLRNLAVSSYISLRPQREGSIKRRRVDAQQSSPSSSIPDHTTVLLASSTTADKLQSQGIRPITPTTPALGEISNSSPLVESTPSPSHSATMPARTLVPVIVCVVLVITGAILAIWYTSRRRRQRRRLVEMRLGRSERAAMNEDDEPAIWDNRPPAATPVPPLRSAYTYGIDTFEYSPTATVFSPMSLTFPPAALEKPSDGFVSKGYEPYLYTLVEPEFSPRSPPRSPPRIVIDQSDLDDARMSLYSVDSYYPPASPVPSSEPGIGMRAISPTVLDTFPSPPPLAHSFHRSISIPDLRLPSADASIRGLSASSEDLSTVPASPVPHRILHRPFESPRSPHQHLVLSQSFGPHPGSNSPHTTPTYGSPRKKRGLQTSRNSLDLIRERGTS